VSTLSSSPGFRLHSSRMQTLESKSIPRSVECTVTSSRGIEFVSDETARSDFDHARSVVAEVTSRLAVAGLISQLPPTVVLIDDYGNGAVELCRIAEGTGLRWMPGLPNR
jgi:hypothetical protein